MVSNKSRLNNSCLPKILNERKRHDEKAKAVEIMRKPKEAITAEDLKHIEKRIVRRENPSSSSTGPSFGKGIRSKTTLTMA